ncbi:transcriptional regulator [Shewanella psychrophila]|uniref:Transcriptional regulator n=1 Tax=Shewanella psychrophila TaxID=225848 RepID=A0A1S6HKU5_9GAMM|nr:MarR family transcriptional regulator [Shewanella psychrophila]AQS36133.1 transcriptional regulator [Shewanella psychrophila]
MSSVTSIRSELRYLVREIGLMDKNCLNSGLSLTQAHLLTYLRRNGQTPFTELTLQLNVDKASLSRTLKTLVDKKYVTAHKKDTDKRQTWFSVCSDGLLRLEQADSLANTELYDMLEGINDQELQSVITALRTLRLNVFRVNAKRNRARIQIERLSSVYLNEVNSLIANVFSGEQGIPEDLVPIAADITCHWWAARSGEYVLGAVSL